MLQGQASPSVLAPDHKRRWLLFSLWIACSVAVFWHSLGALLHYALGNDDASHILLIPFISAWLLFVDRKRIFRQPATDPIVSAILLIPGIILLIWSTRIGSLSAFALALVFLWSAGFALIFGRKVLKSARFPLLFLLLFVPLPNAVLDKVVYLLQKGSAEISSFLFSLTTVPVLREGFVFHLPRYSIEVARECSGIRSSIALLVLSLLISHFYLRAFWKQAVFLLAGFLVMIIKNGVRIVTLTLLANYVDPGFLFGNLHRQGGIVFFMIGLLFLVPVFWLLQRSKPHNQASEIKPAPAV
jgi:exosortase